MLSPFPVRLVRQDHAADVVSPPYDALTSEQRVAHLAAHPRSYLRVTRSPIDHPDDSPEELARASRAALEQLLAHGMFETPRTGLVLYELQQGGHRQIGIVGEIDAHDTDQIRPHEQTRSDRARQMAEHLDIVGAWSSPVALTHRSDPSLDALVGELTAGSPDLELVGHHGSDHRLWVIDDAAGIAALRERFGSSVVYVIDGHHRLAAARASTRRPRLLVVAFPHDQVQVKAFNRVVSSVAPDDVLRELGPLTPVPAGAEPEHVEPGTAVVLTTDGAFRFALPRLRVVDLGDELDVSRLQRGVFEPLLGIDDPRSDPRLDHVPAAAGPALLRSMITPDALGFVLHPMELADLLAVADAGVDMPPKSTSFEPKARSGLFVRLLDDR